MFKKNSGKKKERGCFCFLNFFRLKYFWIFLVKNASLGPPVSAVNVGADVVQLHLVLSSSGISLKKNDKDWLWGVDKKRHADLLNVLDPDV